MSTWIVPPPSMEISPFGLCLFLDLCESQLFSCFLIHQVHLPVLRRNILRWHILVHYGFKHLPSGCELLLYGLYPEHLLDWGIRLQKEESWPTVLEQFGRASEEHVWLQTENIVLALSAKFCDHQKGQQYRYNECVVLGISTELSLKLS